MKLVTLFYLLLLSWIPRGSSKADFPLDTATGAYRLNSRNFDSHTRDGSVWLVEFMAPWCGHCRTFEMEYETVASTLHKMHNSVDRQVKVGKVDADAERAIASRFGIQGFPSFYVIDGWNVYEYSGARSKEALVKFSTKGYKEVQPLSFLTSPMGPIGQFQALLMLAGTTVIDFFIWMKDGLGLSPVMTGIILCIGGLLTSIIGMIVIVFFASSKDKED